MLSKTKCFDVEVGTFGCPDPAITPSRAHGTHKQKFTGDCDLGVS